MAFIFDKVVRLIRQTKDGRERNMYSHLRDLFANVLGHDSANIIIDSPQEGTGGNSPDLAIRCDTGLVDAKGRVIYHDWIVVEAKDEKDAFSDLQKREKIFEEKQKYIRPETEWFVMVDPECIVVRPIAVRTKIDASKDKVFYWKDFASAKNFREKLSELHLKSATNSPALVAFRAGDESRIAVVQVDVTDKKKKLSEEDVKRLLLAKRDFLGVVRDGTKMLQGACREALADWAPAIADVDVLLNKFSEDWGGYKFGGTYSYGLMSIQGKNRINSKEEAESYRAQLRVLHGKKFKQNMAVGKLAAVALPVYRRRSDTDNSDIFAIESANLILARILLLRFFEDHNFFGNEKYVCNGGVAVLQDFMRLHKKGYTAVLSAAYERGREVYDDAFDETDLDWVLSSPSRRVSHAIEMVMMLLSRFDFSTISGDILTGIYDRFLDREQRKVMGEFYTPPSVARYIIRRLDIKPTDSVFDPSCGSGTFLLEAFAHMTKGDVRSGAR